MTETPEEKQARFDKNWAERMARNAAAAQAAKEAAEAKKHPGKQAAAHTRHDEKPKHAEKTKDSGGKRRK